MKSRQRWPNWRKRSTRMTSRHSSNIMTDAWLKERAWDIHRFFFFVGFVWRLFVSRTVRLMDCPGWFVHVCSISTVVGSSPLCKAFVWGLQLERPAGWHNMTGAALIQCFILSTPALHKSPRPIMQRNSSMQLSKGSLKPTPESSGAVQRISTHWLTLQMPEATMMA